MIYTLSMQKGLASFCIRSQSLFMVGLKIIMTEPLKRLGRIAVLLVIAVGAVASLTAAGPITPRFAADPSPHAFAGQVYLYATDDASNSGTYWDSTAWRLYRSSDLKSWQDMGSFLSVKAFRWARPDAKAWAPEAVYRNHRYYFYAPVGGDTIGVAVSDQPGGPFRDARGSPLIDKARNANAGAEPIDPAVLIDRDRRAYLYFGSRTPKVVELASDMIHTRGPIHDIVITGMEQAATPTRYGEAPFMVRRGRTYIFSFSTGWPGQIVYATGAGATGPFIYRGVVLDYRRLSTNHHAIFAWQGRWYLFYHDRLLPGASDYRRSITCAPLHLGRSRFIEEVKVLSPTP